MNAPALTWRERQLLAHFRAADPRGQHTIEDMARHQAEIAAPRRTVPLGQVLTLPPRR